MNTALLQDAVTIFLGIVVEALPFLLLGVLASSLVHVYLKNETLVSLIPKGRWGSVLAGPLMGFMFPVCECGNIPLARRMLQKGIPLHTVIAFLLSAPVFNPIVILATYAAFKNQPGMVVLRVVLSLTVALTVSALFSLCKNQERLINPDVLKKASSKGCECHPGENQQRSKWQRFTQNMRSELTEMGSLLMLGGLVASFSQVIIPRETLTSLGRGPISSVLAMMGLAAVISICSNVDAFFALSYVNNFSTGSLLAFLVFGPMIDIKALIMLPKLLKVKTIALMTLVIAQLVFLITVFYNLNIS